MRYEKVVVHILKHRTEEMEEGGDRSCVHKQLCPYTSNKSFLNFFFRWEGY